MMRVFVPPFVIQYDFLKRTRTAKGTGPLHRSAAGLLAVTR